jgi:hypothetical protein
MGTHHVVIDILDKKYYITIDTGNNVTKSDNFTREQTSLYHPETAIVAQTSNHRVLPGLLSLH